MYSGRFYFHIKWKIIHKIVFKITWYCQIKKYIHNAKTVQIRNIITTLENIYLCWKRFQNTKYVLTSATFVPRSKWFSTVKKAFHGFIPCFCSIALKCSYQFLTFLLSRMFCLYSFLNILWTKMADYVSRKYNAD